VAKRYHLKSSALLQKIHDPDVPVQIRWTPSGTVFIDDCELIGSNIIKLLKNTFHNSKNKVAGETRWKEKLISSGLLEAHAEPKVSDIISGAIANDVQRKVVPEKWYFLGPAV
jgi:hypothetical protein